MHLRTLILSAAVSLFAITAAYADVTPGATASGASTPATKKVLQHLAPKPAPVMVKESARMPTRYESLEFGLLTIGTLTTSGGQPSAK